MPDLAPFEYVVIRIVPRVERDEFINAGVMMICRPKRFLCGRFDHDPARLRALFPTIDDDLVAQIGNHLSGMEAIASGDPRGGTLAQLDMGERWHWLTAPSSTVIQPSPVHTGFCRDPQQQLDALFDELVAPVPKEN